MKKIVSLLLVLVMSFAICVPAFAAPGTITAAGFYNIGTVANVTITPEAEQGTVVELDADVDGDSEYDEKLYANSDKLSVTYSAANKDAFYGVILVEGTKLPTIDDAIFYIDQLTATENGDIEFEVYPILPTKTTDLTLYISSNVESDELVKVTLNYAVKGAYNVKDVPFVKGDINGDGLWNSTDALLALQIGAGLYDATETEKMAANVNGDGYINSTDALMILQYGAGIIDSWTK